MNPDPNTFYSHGKLLLTGEYLVLDGALALAVPALFGQSLQVHSSSEPRLRWQSFDHNKVMWFETEFKLTNNTIQSGIIDANPLSERLFQILNAAQQLNPEFLSAQTGYDINTQMDFPKNWGLGTSSTLINNVANWANVDAYELLKLTFGGSGYDIACAQAPKSLTYQLKSTKQVTLVNFDPPFKQHIYFVHLNKKQDSREGIAQYRDNTADLTASISKITTITKGMISSETLEGFQDLMDAHEELISETIHQTPVKTKLFSDFKGSIKSLGAWGGDFVMVASETDPRAYFESKGYRTILSYSEMVRHS